MRGLVVAVFALLALAPAAHADVTIGSSLPLPDNPISCMDGCTASSTAIPNRPAAAPAGGVVTRWRIRAGNTVEPVHLVVLRRTGLAGQVVARSATVTPLANEINEYATRLPIAAGDAIGIDCCPGTNVGDYARAADPSAATEFWEPRLEDGQTRDRDIDFQLELTVNADIEDDRDADGLGDTSQDADDDNDSFADASDVCPYVTGVAPAGCPRVNQPPTVRFRTPVSGSAVAPAQAIELEVSDDAGLPTVSVFDDDGTVCTVSAPPYTCTWTPTGADVGRATLLASAVDSDGRSTLGIVRVRVPRFEARLTRRVRGRRVTGRLVLPAVVTRAQGCRGDVLVRRGRVRRTVELERNCTYSVRLPRGSGRVRASFGGNPVVAPA